MSDKRLPHGYYERDPDYLKWIEDLSAQCSCCSECMNDIPCGGLQAGGMCDSACRCGDELEWIEP